MIGGHDSQKWTTCRIAELTMSHCTARLVVYYLAGSRLCH
jgi:hypothetical protein